VAEVGSTWFRPDVSSVAFLLTFWPPVVRRFHGTSSLCGVGINVGDSPCSSSECAVCGILTIGFDTNHAGSGAVGGQQRHLRYGKGIYSSATPGKANDYAAESERVHAGKKYRTQFVVSVAAGRVFKTRAGDLDLKTMPPLDSKGVSYDSVVGEVGYALNHDELVVYDDSAILPRFFIVRTCEPPTWIVRTVHCVTDVFPLAAASNSPSFPPSLPPAGVLPGVMKMASHATFHVKNGDQRRDGGGTCTFKYRLRRNSAVCSAHCTIPAARYRRGLTATLTMPTSLRPVHVTGTSR
jgi:hypothetical protein